MTGEKEMTVREATIFAIGLSKEEFKKLKADFEKVSGLFDEGKDQDGLRLIASDVVPKVKNLFDFCHTLIVNFDKVFTPELKNKFQKEYLSLEDLMNTLIEQTEKGDFTEIGDILRFDFNDLIENLSDLFPDIAECFRESDIEELDKY
jgi:hypothetical protein